MNSPPWKTPRISAPRGIPCSLAAGSSETGRASGSSAVVDLAGSTRLCTIRAMLGSPVPRSRRPMLMSRATVDAPLIVEQVNDGYDRLGHTLRGGPAERRIIQCDPVRVAHGAQHTLAACCAHQEGPSASVQCPGLTQRTPLVLVAGGGSGAGR
jgi:hypothetical protein